MTKEEQLKIYSAYLVDRHGNIFYSRSGKMLKMFKDRYGYWRVNVTVSGKSYQKLVHRIIAIAFIPNPMNKQQVNHKNGIKTDNRVENLEWVTNSENRKHAVENKLHKHQKIAVYKNKKLIGVFNSFMQCSFHIKIPYTTLRYWAKGLSKNNSEYQFELLNRNPNT
ncbi:HNH endonuclease signature motif containing protein [Chryseobacterium indologenes]|uniref:HNH endonuclease signature motif containing protein n=1 Tax=Chryseobacterium indologenes TaxID=253 RepID=UPI001F4B4DCA|nr:HNH endonuclease signature motif containing protein [Chryseobacterium indologenes]